MSGRAVLPVMVALALSLVAPGGEAPRTSHDNIEQALSRIAGLQDATFIRNGRSYDAATAATFLRRKWESNAGSVTNLADFIARVASFSGTSGKPYRIRFHDGSETNCGDYLRSIAVTNGWLMQDAR